MSDTQSRTQTMPQQRPQQTRPKPTTLQWSQEAADAAYNTAETFGKTLVDREDAVEATMRDLIKAVYLFLTAIFTQNLLAPMRRMWRDATEGEDDEYTVPREILRYLAGKGIKKPHLRAANPFLSVVQHFVLMARVEQKQMTTAEAKTIDAAAQDIEKQRKNSAAMSTRMSRYAQLLLAAIDMDDVTILDRPFSFLPEYAKWKNVNPTLSAKFRADPSKAAAARAAKEAAKASAATDDETLEILRQDDPFGDESFTDFEDGNADTMKVVVVDGEPVSSPETAQHAPGSATDAAAELAAKLGLTPEQEQAVTTAQTGLGRFSEAETRPAAVAVLTTGPAPIDTTTTSEDAKPKITDDQDMWWLNFAQSFERPYNPIPLRVSRATIKDLGLDETNEEGFFRYVVTNGELIITGVRHGMDR